MSDTLIYEVDGPLAVLTLNRPRKLNAINTTMMADINEAMNQAEEDIKIRAIVLSLIHGLIDISHHFGIYGIELVGTV